MLDLFSILEIAPALRPDENQLRQNYLSLQKKWHPDFFGHDPDAQATALKQTAVLNEAWKTLRDLPGRVQYVLESYGLWKEGEKHTLPAEFLMEMLDLNDLISEAAAGDEKALKQAEKELTGLTTDTEAEMENLCRKADGEQESWGPDYFRPLRENFEKLRYLTRLKKNLEGDFSI